ncbi:MAG TPA: ATP-dependent Clp protease adaptor ClpS [Bacteroidales bacterium]|nr:ATP-dependent Clp protease adaptor ClpS [Bacteroidales bacterium]
MADRLRDKPVARENKNSGSSSGHFLVLYNDEINTFDYVMESLMEVCGHSSVQAEQCTIITHYRGQCDVKKGVKKELRSMQLDLIKKGLKAGID